MICMNLHTGCSNLHTGCSKTQQLSRSKHANETVERGQKSRTQLMTNTMNYLVGLGLGGCGGGNGDGEGRGGLGGGGGAGGLAVRFDNMVSLISLYA